MAKKNDAEKKFLDEYGVLIAICTVVSMLDLPEGTVITIIPIEKMTSKKNEDLPPPLPNPNPDSFF